VRQKMISELHLYEAQALRAGRIDQTNLAAAPISQPPFKKFKVIGRGVGSDPRGFKRDVNTVTQVLPSHLLSHDALYALQSHFHNLQSHSVLPCELCHHA
jgi:hypothetical protein